MSNLKIQVYKSPLLSSNMYAIKSNKNLIVIDPWSSNDLIELIYKDSLKIDFIILTHEHYDHISGVNWLTEKFNCKVICNKECAIAIERPELNFSKYFSVLMEVMSIDKVENQPEQVELYSCYANITFERQKTMEWEGHKIELISTPGHSKGSICIVVDDKYLFSGDSLLKDYMVITKLKGGSLKDYKEKTISFFKSLPKEIVIYPGHYESFKLIEKINQL